MPDPIPTGRGGPDGIPIVFQCSGSGNYTFYNFHGQQTGPPDDHPYANGNLYVWMPWANPASDPPTAFWSASLSQDPVVDENGHAEEPGDGFYSSGGCNLNAHPGLPTVLAKGPSGETYTIPEGTGTQVSGSWTGTLSVTVRVREYAVFDYLDPTEAVYFPDPDDPNSLPFPVTGGNAMPDGIPARKVRLFVAPIVGSTVTATATCNGGSASQSFPFVAGDPFFHGMSLYLLSDGGGATGYVNADPKVANVRVFEGCQHTHTEPNGSWSAVGSLSVYSNGPVDSGNRADMSARGDIPTQYRYTAKAAGSDGQPWGLPLTVSCPSESFDFTGEGSLVVRRRSYAIQDVYGLPLSTVSGESVDEKGGYESCSLAQSSLRGSHLDTRDWRLEFQTYPGGTMTSACASSTTVYVGSAATVGYAGERAGLWGGYRYLERTVTAPAGRRVTLDVAGSGVGKSFAAVKAADGAEWVRFDLCSPTNLPAGNDGVWKRDSPYPLQPQPTHYDSPVNAPPDDDLGYLDGIVEPPGSGDPDETNQTWLEGVDTVSTATFSVETQDGDVAPTFGNARLVAGGTPKLTLSEGFCGQGKVLQDGYDCLKLWPMSAYGGRTTETGSVWGAPFLTITLDGKLVYALPGCAYRQFVVGGYEWSYDSVATLAANLGHYIGWSATVSGDPNFYGLSPQSAYANCLGDRNVVDVSLAAVNVVDRYDWVQAWPGCGDPWHGSSNVGEPCPLAVFKVLGTRSQGLVFQGDDSASPGAPLSDLDVWNERTDNPTASTSVQAKFGQGTSGSDGSYSTSVLSGPVGKPPPGYVYDGLEYGDETATTTLQQAPKPQEESRFRARWIKRTGFRAIKAAQKAIRAWLAQSHRGQLHLGLASGSDLKYRKAKTTTHERGFYVDATPLSGPIVSAKPVIDESRRSVGLAVTRKNGDSRDFYWHESFDDGKTFDTGVLVSADAFGNYGWPEASGARGRTWFAYDSGTSATGVQKGQRTKAAPGSPFGSTFTFQSVSGSTRSDIKVADGGWCNVEEARDGQRRLVWYPTIAGESSPSNWFSIDGGATWTRVPDPS